MSRFKKNLPDGDYSKGYIDGMLDSMEHNGLSAYYTGVGYGKRATNVKNLGFNSEKERQQFERGVKHKDNHFNALRVEPKSWLERFIDIFDRSARQRRKKSAPKLRSGNVPRLAAPKQPKKRYRKRHKR